MTEQEVTEELAERLAQLLDEAEADLGRALTPDEEDSLTDEFLAGLDEEEEPSRPFEPLREFPAGGAPFCDSGVNKGKPGPCPSGNAPEHKPGKEAPGGKTPPEAMAVRNTAWDSMSPDERSAVEDYTGEGHRKLNAGMRKCPPTFECLPPKAKEQLDRIESAIAKAPALPEPLLVHRGIDVDDATGRAIAAAASQAMAGGRPFALSYVTSTSFDPKAAGEFENGPGEGVMLRITAKHGLPVEGKSFGAGEHEMILSSKAQYRVTRVEGKTVHLEQL